MVSTRFIALKLAALDKKVLRDLGGMWAQALAIALVIAAGVAMFVMSEGMLKSLFETRAAYYERYGFAHVFAPLKRAPNALKARLENVPGVRVVETRIKYNVTLDMPDLIEPVEGEVLSYPVGGEPRLNRLRLVAGRWLSPGQGDEVLVGESFAEGHGLGPGDQVTVLLNGRKRALDVVGIVLSPEYIYAIAPGAMMPDNKRFGVLWMSVNALEAAFDMEGAFNDVIVALAPGSRAETVIAAVDQVLAPYGGVGAFTRDRQVSDWYLMGEMDQLRNTAQIVPPIFLAIAAFLLNVVIGRWIDTEREEIGLLKAFGYTTVQVAAHYVKLVLAITLVGVALGFAGGVWLGRELAELYQEFFRFPFLHYSFEVSVFTIAGAVSVVAALLGTWGAVKRAALLPPAEAMAPPPPTTYTRTALEAWFKRMAAPNRMIVRHILRWPGRSGLTVLGNATAVAVLIGSMFFMDAMEHLIDVQFNRAERQDATLSFIEAKAPRALDAVGALPGVLVAEPFRAVSARLHFQGAERRESLTGLVSDARLGLVLDDEFLPVPIPERGLVLSTKLAEMLGAGLGDVVMVEVTEGRRPVLALPVVQVSETLLGSPAYVNFDELGRLLGEEGRISGVRVKLDPALEDAFFRAVKNTPGVAGVAIKRTSLKAFRDTMAENILLMTFFNVLFAGVIAVGVVYNSARISLSERARELASLRVLGFTLGEVAYILLGELALLTVVALPLGCAMGYGLAALWTLQLDTDLYRIPLMVSRDTYGFSTLVVVAAAAVSALVVFRHVKRLDLVAALKTRE